MKFEKFLAWQLWLHYLTLGVVQGFIALYGIPTLIGGTTVCYFNPPYPLWYIAEYLLLFGVSLTVLDLTVHVVLGALTGWDD